MSTVTIAAEIALSCSTFQCQFFGAGVGNSIETIFDELIAKATVEVDFGVTVNFARDSARICTTSLRFLIDH